MKISRILTLIVLLVCVVTASVFAAPASGTPGGDEQRHTGETLKKGERIFKEKGFKCKDGCMMHKDPVEALKERKEKIQELLKEGKISKEKADAIIAKIDAKIKAIEEFNKLAPEQKKEKLMNDFKTWVDKKVKEGKLTREKGDALIREFSEKLKNWDGTGYPKFLKRGSMSGKKLKIKERAQ